MADEYADKTPAENTMAIHPDALVYGDEPPADQHSDVIPLATKEPERPKLRPFADEDPYGFKNKGEGDLRKKTHFDDPASPNLKYPMLVYKDGKHQTVNDEDAFNAASGDGWSRERGDVQVEEPVVVQPIPVVVVPPSETNGLPVTTAASSAPVGSIQHADLEPEPPSDPIV
jgi:hypothetical protein